MATRDFLSGHPGHLDEAQTTALAQFRTNLEQAGLAPSTQEERDKRTAELGYDRFDDQTLLRFLRARKFDLPKAQLMWEGNEKWRKEFGADEIAANGFPYPEGPQVMAFYPQFYHKTDREGRPIYIEQLGKLDTTKLAQLTNQDRQLHHLVDEYERFLKDRLPATTKVEGQLVETSCTILDLTNAGISTFYRVKDYVSAASNIGQNHCELPSPKSSLELIDLDPETMGHMFIVNAPYLFSTVWSLVKPWLDEATVRKIHILGRNYKQELQQYIDPANLPTDLGGTCRCEKDGGCALSNAGPWTLAKA